MQNTRKIKATEVQESRFYQLPKWLIHDEEFKGLSNDAKVLYSIMRDRHDLSLKNNWVDEDGFIYMIYTRQAMMEDLQVSDKSVTKLVKELKKYGLIDEKRQGCNKPNLTYVLTVDLDYQWTRKNYEPGTGTFTNPEPENLRANDTNTSETDISDINTTGASKDAVVTQQEEVILKDTNIKTLTAHQKKIVATWDMTTLIRAIQIYKAENGLYFKLLAKIYNDGAITSLTAKKTTTSRYTDILQHNYNYDEMDRLDQELIARQVAGRVQ